LPSLERDDADEVLLEQCQASLQVVKEAGAFSPPAGDVLRRYSWTIDHVVVIQAVPVADRPTDLHYENRPSARRHKYQTTFPSHFWALVGLEYEENRQVDGYLQEVEGEFEGRV
jgi:hypothetical protein